MRFVFVMDPVSGVLVDEDTSFALMLQAQKQGYRVDHCLVQDVGWIAGRVIAKVRQATMSRESAAPIVLGEPEKIDLGEVDAVFIRKDPPFDDAYHWLTLVLELLRGVTLVVNDPKGLRDANEKLYTCHFTEVMPKTLVSADKEAIVAFVSDVGARAVIKPIDGHGGEGVFFLSAQDKNLNGLIEAATLSGSRIAMVQAFIPEVSEGDKRILLVDGEPLGAVLRVPQGGDVRSNIHVGGLCAPAEVTDADQRIIDLCKPRLIKDGLFFVGLDVIGGHLTEVNVTSPTCIQQMEGFSGRNLSQMVIEALVARIE